jgi:CubicO group peptidase (beta-lactamase class C family)
VLIMLAMLAALAGSDLEATRQARDSQWKAWLDGQQAGFSGVVLIGRDDAIEAEAAFGLADQLSGRRNTVDTRFNLGSINKTFTAVAIAQLVQQGRLSLDDALAKHVPDYPNQAAAGRITIRDLLTHRSGVAQFMRAEFGDASVAEMVKRVGVEPQVFEPGARQEYSNGGYVVLGRVIEVVSGKPYSAYVNDHIYRPAGMTASGFFRHGDRVDDLARPVGSAGGADQRPSAGLGLTPTSPRTGNPAGGGYSTAADLFRFSRALRAGRLLDQQMTRYVLEGTFAEQPRWGFSLREQVVGAHRFLGNGGGAPGVNAGFRFEPSGAYTVVVLSNSSPPAATNLLVAVLNRIAGVESAPALSTQSTTSTRTAVAAGGLRAEVEALHAEMQVAFREQPANVAHYYTTEARILGGGRRYSGAAQIVAYWSQIPAGATWTIEIVDVGGSALEPWVLARSTLGRSGGASMTVDYLAILRRGADGRLKYHIDMFTAGVR